MHYYQFNIGDYVSHTRHLTLIEDAIYRRLLDAYYLNERPLNECLTIVARQINAREYENEVKIILEEFFQLTENGWINIRADKEIEHFHSKIQQASNAGKASAAARLNKRSTGVQLTNNQEPITNNHKPINKVERATRLTQDWKPSDDMIQFCLQERPDLDWKFVSDGFRDYWISQAGVKGKKIDWEATWRNWVRNQRIAYGNKMPINGKSENQLTAERLMARLNND